MIIKIPDHQVQHVLAHLKCAKDLMGIALLITIIEKELQDKIDVDQALQTRDKTELERLLGTVNEGFNRFRVLAALADMEKNDER